MGIRWLARGWLLVWLVVKPSWGSDGSEWLAVGLVFALAFAFGAPVIPRSFGGWLGQDVSKLDGVLEDVNAGFFEGDSGTHLHGELP